MYIKRKKPLVLNIRNFQANSNKSELVSEKFAGKNVL